MKKTKIIPFAPKAMLANTAEKAQETAERVQETAQNVWLAGLGALTLAEDRGGQLFRTLVKRGSALDSKNRKLFSAMVKDVEARVEIVKDNVAEATSGTVEKIGAGIENGMASVMHTLGVPTRKEIHTLTRKVDALSSAVDQKAKAAIKMSVRKVRKAAREATR